MSNTVLHSWSGRVGRRTSKMSAWAQGVSTLAAEAMIDEVELTPKPALVDGRGSGAHDDLTLDSMRRSAWSLAPTFETMALCAHGRQPDRFLREDLAAIGRAGEPAMFAATGGSNAHRGAIWALGLLIGGLSINPHGTPDLVASLAAEIASFPDRFIPQAPSNGQSVAARFGVPGARGEALQGFPHVVRVGLPALRAARAKGAGEVNARLDTLMSIMASLDDTCVLHRGGRPALHVAKTGAGQVLLHGGSGTPNGWAALNRLHDEMMALNASPGGAADMLAATLFLDRACRSAAVSPSH